MNISNQYLYRNITLWRTFHSRQFFHWFPNKKTQTCSFSCWNFFIDGTCLHPSNNKNALWVFFKTKRRRLHGNLKKKRERRILGRILHLGKLSALRLEKKNLQSLRHWCRWRCKICWIILHFAAFVLQVENLVRPFILKDEDYKLLMDIMLGEFNKGLGKETNPTAKVKMYPTYVRDVPDGSGKTQFHLFGGWDDFQ